MLINQSLIYNCNTHRRTSRSTDKPGSNRVKEPDSLRRENFVEAFVSRTQDIFYHRKQKRLSGLSKKIQTRHMPMHCINVQSYILYSLTPLWSEPVLTWSNRQLYCTSPEQSQPILLAEYNKNTICNSFKNV